jgi:phosphoribosylaminoimidazolecarboxamide formyltransferase/IMP cyclohydrolase
MRYGENPHQQAAFYREPGAAPGHCQLPADAGQGTVVQQHRRLRCGLGVRQGLRNSNGTAACVIVKHANPCGVAIAPPRWEAYQKAFKTDPTSAFGGIIAFNCAIDKATAEAVAGQFAEVIIAPEITAEARAVFAAKQNLRVLVVPLAARSRARCSTTSASAAACWCRRPTWPASARPTSRW